MSLLVMLGVGAVGGLGRDFPYGTLLVNLTGSFALGVLVGAALDEDAYRITATGFVGAFTTFSTWALESHRLGEEGRGRLGVVNFGVSLVLGVLAVAAGRGLGVAL